MQPGPSPRFVQPSSQPQINWGSIIGNGIRTIERLEQNNRRNRNDNYDGGFYPQPSYAPQPMYVAPQNYSVPQHYVAPQRYVAPTPTPPPENVVVLKPKSNTLSLKGLDDAGAAFDARIAEEAAKAGDKADTLITALITAEMADKKIPPKALHDWADAVQSGDIEKYRVWQTKYGALLPPAIQKYLATRIGFLDLENGIVSGTLTDKSVEIAIQGLTVEVQDLLPGQIRDGLQQNLAAMQAYSSLSQLSSLVQGSSFALGTLMDGIDAAELPVSLISEISGLPVMAAPPVSESTVAVANIMLLNPEKNRQVVRYVLDSTQFTMNPGEKQSLDRTFQISFDTGNGGAARQYALSTGVYHFVLGTEWDLVKRYRPNVSVKVRE